MTRQIFIIFSFFTLTSCNISDTIQKHNKATEFINTVNTLDESVIPSSERFSNYLQTVGPIAKNGANYQLDQQKIDSLKTYYELFMQSFDIAMSKLSKLKEFDTSFNVIKPSINHMEIIKNSYVLTIPAYLKVYKIGWVEASDSLRNIINQGPEILNSGRISASKQAAIKDTETKRFIGKYKLSN